MLLLAKESPYGRPFQETLLAEVEKSYHLGFKMNEAEHFWPKVQNNTENKLGV